MLPECVFPATTFCEFSHISSQVCVCDLACVFVHQPKRQQTAFPSMASRQPSEHTLVLTLRARDECPDNPSKSNSTKHVHFFCVQLHIDYRLFVLAFPTSLCNPPPLTFAGGNSREKCNFPLRLSSRGTLFRFEGCSFLKWLFQFQTD